MGVYIKANSFFIFNYMFQQCYFKHNNNEVTLTRRKTKFHNFASIFLVTKVLEKKGKTSGKKIQVLQFLMLFQG